MCGLTSNLQWLFDDNMHFLSCVFFSFWLKLNLIIQMDLLSHNCTENTRFKQTFWDFCHNQSNCNYAPQLVPSLEASLITLYLISCWCNLGSDSEAVLDQKICTKQHIRSCNSDVKWTQPTKRSNNHFQSGNILTLKI